VCAFFQYHCDHPIYRGAVLIELNERLQKCAHIVNAALSTHPIDMPLIDLPTLLMQHTQEYY
jgi:capsule polysaccharide modification protein KpsS